MTNVMKTRFYLHRENWKNHLLGAEITYADQLLMLIRNAAAKENQMKTEIKQEKEIA